jgi:hypothetical protein
MSKNLRYRVGFFVFESWVYVRFNFFVEQSFQDDEECEVYLAMLLMMMYIELGLVKEFNIDEVTLFRYKKKTIPKFSVQLKC